MDSCRTFELLTAPIDATDFPSFEDYFTLLSETPLVIPAQELELDPELAAIEQALPEPHGRCVPPDILVNASGGMLAVTSSPMINRLPARKERPLAGAVMHEIYA